MPESLIDLGKQCSMLGCSVQKENGERMARPRARRVSRDKQVMTERAPMTRLANEGQPSATITAVTPASPIVLHSIPEFLGCPFFFYYSIIIDVLLSQHLEIAPSHYSSVWIWYDLFD